MHHTLLRATPLAAFALLAACNTQPTTITSGGPNDPTANEIAAAPPVKLPPALLSSKSYRCKDNSLLFVDFFNDDTSANVKKAKDGDPIHLTAPAAGQPYVGEGYTIKGVPADKSLTITEPGKGAQACVG